MVRRLRLDVRNQNIIRFPLRYLARFAIDISANNNEVLSKLRHLSSVPANFALITFPSDFCYCLCCLDSTLPFIDQRIAKALILADFGSAALKNCLWRH